MDVSLTLGQFEKSGVSGHVSRKIAVVESRICLSCMPGSRSRLGRLRVVIDFPRGSDSIMFRNRVSLSSLD